VAFLAGSAETRREGADGVSLRVRTGGDGPTVVLLHGHPRTHTTWHRVAPLLAAAGPALLQGPAASLRAVGAGGSFLTPPTRSGRWPGTSSR
jgi:haloacetate dehalogenase